jgi:hypothetical protein
MEITRETLDVILAALAEQLRSLDAQQEIVVIGGPALTALGLVMRATRDVDLLAIAEDGELRPAEPLPEALRTARDRVARDFDLADNWLNGGPTDLLTWGLPTGFMTRVVTTLRPCPHSPFRRARGSDSLQALRYGRPGRGRHEADLRALHPSKDELIAAARWSVTQDPSPGYRMVLMDVLSALGVEDADLGT